MGFVFYSALAIFSLLCVLLCALILVQEGKSQGMGAAFGASEASDSLFGTSTADVLKRFTAYLATAFALACILLSVWTGSMARNRTTELAPKIIERNS